MQKRQKLQIVKVPPSIMAGIDMRKYRKQKLPSDTTSKKENIHIGSRVVFERGIVTKKKYSGKIRSFPDPRGAYIYTDHGEYFVLWEDIHMIYVKKGEFVQIPVNESTLGIYNKAIDEIKELAEKVPNLSVMDTHNPHNYCIRALTVKFESDYFVMNIENKTQCKLICESNFTRKTTPKIENGEVKLSTVMSRLRYINRKERENRKRLKELNKKNKAKK